uniref:ligand-dependent nuclear receptor-interacting factor 1 n=1 Tax=Epinephelus lanceolatus TaxID=310571 RepID=UPI001445CD95|nr:ligand-dependent nuclear receptor-interacting factor 1 [Epinephelus lanceolatus]
MYPSTKAMDSVHSGTGVFYQAMPAVGADGKNIMKLIPVQIVNGQFVQSQISQPKTNPTSQKAVTINIASAPVQVVKKSALNPSATEQIVRKHFSLMDVFPNQADLDLGHSLNKHPLQQQHVNLMSIVPPVATPATNSGKLGRVPSQLPVTALPRGQYLQIPSNSQVPASERPASIKKQIFTPPPSSSPSQSLSSLVYVPPITTVNRSTTLQSDSPLHSLGLLCETSSNTLCGTPSKGSKPHLKLIPKASQRPNSPIKWVIEEEESTAAPTLDPVTPCVTSEILRIVAERENANKHCDVIKKIASLSSGQRQENTLVTDNRNVVFVAKNRSLAYKMGTSDSPTAAQKSCEFNKIIVSSSQQSLEPVAPQMKQGLQVIIPHESDEVIDLCDDDGHDDSSQQAASAQMSAVTQPDEDNVIFVSYIPPKAESESTQDLRPQTQVPLIKETDQTDTRSGVTQQKNLNGTTDNEICAHRRRATDQSMSYNTVKNLRHVCDLPVMNMHDNEGSHISSQQITSTQQLERMEVDVETKSPADPNTSDSSSGICSLIEEDTHRMESSVNPTASCTSSLAPESLQRSDNLLRQIFGITANVKICLQRIDGASDWSLIAESLWSESIRSDNREPDSGLKEKELFLKDLYSLQDTDSSNGHINVRKVTGQELSEDSATPSPHTDIGPLKCSHFKLNTQALSLLRKKCHSGNTSLKGISCDVETEPVIGYMEPIDEDFLSTDENDIPNSQDTASQPQTQTCADLNTNTTRRMGRMRKRTVCPCCIPCTQDPVVKSSARSQEPEKWAWRTEQTNKRGGKTKAVRKYVKTSGRISCLTAKKKHNCKTSDEASASNSLTTTSMDTDELKQCEQIRRLKELLKEKEAALELLRNSSG